MKAQFWSFDMIFAIVIFVFAMVMLMYVWITLSNQFSLSYGSSPNLVQWQLQNLGTNLLQPGKPVNWESVVNTTNVATWNNVSIGFGTLGGSGLSYNKVMSFYAMANKNYSETKALMGVSYDYYIMIKGSDFNINIGRNPALYNSFSTQVLNEPVVIGGLPAQMTIEVWTNTTFGID